MERYRKQQSRKRTQRRIILLVTLIAVAVLIGIGASSLFPGCTDGLPQIGLGETGLVQHIHAHLDVFVNASPIQIPGSVGHLSSGNLCALHAHDTTGIIHIETPVARTFTVQEYIDLWGYPIPSSAKVYVNGVAVADSLSHTLAAHDEIAIVIGTPPSTIPSSYTFPTGL